MRVLAIIAKDPTLAGSALLRSMKQDPADLRSRLFLNRTILLDHPLRHERDDHGVIDTPWSRPVTVRRARSGWFRFVVSKRYILTHKT